jgi:hypothetical protein
MEWTVMDQPTAWVICTTIVCLTILIIWAGGRFL